MNLKQEAKLSICGVSDFCIMNLDTDLLIEIFSRLPINSIVRCKRVCKEWHKLLSIPDFTHNYAKNPPFITSLVYRFPELTNFCNRIPSLLEVSENGECFMTNIAPKSPDYVEGISTVVCIGSCNGLMCFLVSKPWEVAVIYICNPITGDFTTIPTPDEEKLCLPIWGRLHRKPPYYEFGFCPFTNKIKVLKIPRDTSSGVRAECEIFTVGVDDKWRCLSEDVSYWTYKFFFHGAFHWLAQPDGSDDYMIYTFHIGEEKEGRIAHPRGVDLDDRMSLRSLNNRLCIFDRDYDSSISLWIMQEYGVEQSWTNQSIVTSWVPSNFGGLRYDPSLLEILPNGEMLFLVSSEQCIISCKLKNKKCTVVKDFAEDEKYYFSRYSYSLCVSPLYEIIMDGRSSKTMKP